MTGEAGKHEETVNAFREDIRQLAQAHQKTFDALMSSSAPIPLDIGEILEDLANLYLAMSEAVSEKYLLSRRNDVE
jgi:hypothetical protein